jgi:hypothetical protein
VALYGMPQTEITRSYVATATRLDERPDLDHVRYMFL